MSTSSCNVMNHCRIEPSPPDTQHRLSMARRRLEKKMICPHPSAKKQVMLRMHHGDANVPAKGRRFPSAHVLDLNVIETPFRGCGRRPNTKGVACVPGGNMKLILACERRR